MHTFEEYDRCNLQAFEAWKAEKISAIENSLGKTPTDAELLTLAANVGAIARQWATLEITRRTLKNN